MRFQSAHVLAAVMLFAGCREEPAPAPPNAMENASAADAVAAPAARSAEKRPERIYYDLTRYDWYARGEALQHDGRSYQPDGGPVAMTADAFSRAGEYQGVDYYVGGTAESRDALYVPVFDGYWLPFTPVGAAAPANH